MAAIIETGGKQYRVNEGDILHVERLNGNENDELALNVLAIENENGIVVGTPYVDGAKVTARVVKQGKGKKINVFTYRAKKGSKRAMGHRQPYTRIQITSIVG